MLESAFPLVAVSLFGNSVRIRLCLLSADSAVKTISQSHILCDKVSTSAFLKSPIPKLSEQSCKATGRSSTHPQFNPQCNV